MSTESDDCIYKKLRYCAEKRASETQAINVKFEVNAKRRRELGPEKR